MALYIDLPSKRIEVFKEEILINQLRDENEEKAKAFDDQYHEQFAAMSAEYTRLAANLWAGVRSLKAENALDTGQAAAGSLLQYALKTIEALIDLLRRGYRNQVGMLARNALEIIATVICIASDPDTLENVEKGKFKSSKAISTAKRVVPLFGQLYGELSNQLTHLTIDDFLW